MKTSQIFLLLWGISLIVYLAMPGRQTALVVLSIMFVIIGAIAALGERSNRQ